MIKEELYEIIKANCFYVTKQELSEMIFEYLDRAGINIFENNIHLFDLSIFIDFKNDKTIKESIGRILKYLHSENINI